MTHPWTLLLGLALVAGLFVLLPVVVGAYLRLRSLRGLWLLTCPQTHMQAVVRLDAFYAAWTAAFRRRPLLHVQGCTLWSRGSRLRPALL